MFPASFGPAIATKCMFAASLHGSDAYRRASHGNTIFDRRNAGSLRRPCDGSLLNARLANDFGQPVGQPSWAPYGKSGEFCGNFDICASKQATWDQSRGVGGVPDP
jgi:hypothetical protein